MIKKFIFISWLLFFSINKISVKIEYPSIEEIKKSVEYSLFKDQIDINLLTIILEVVEQEIELREKESQKILILPKILILTCKSILEELKKEAPLTRSLEQKIDQQEKLTELTKELLANYFVMLVSDKSK